MGFKFRNPFGEVQDTDSTYTVRDAHGNITDSASVYSVRDAFGNVVLSDTIFPVRDAYGGIVTSDNPIPLRNAYGEVEEFNYGGATPLVQGPWYDQFGGTGSISGRTLDSGGATWTEQRYLGTGTVTNQTGGNVIGSGTNPQQGFAYVNRAASAGNMWVTRRGMTQGTLGIQTNTYVLADHIGISGSTARWMHCASQNNTGLATTMDIRSYNESNVSTLFGANTINTFISPGDSTTVRYAGLDTGSPTAALYVNGQRIVTPQPITVATNPITNNYGMRGATVMSVDEFRLADPDTDRFIELIAPGKNIHCGANGDVQGVVTFRVRGGMPAAGDLRYSLINETTGSVITGHDNQPISNLQTGVTIGVNPTDDTAAQIGRCTIGTLTTAQLAGDAPFSILLSRTDVTVGTIAASKSPPIRRSVCGVPVGQSLAQQGYAANGTVGNGEPNTTPTNDWVYDCTNQYGTADLWLGSSVDHRVRRQRSSGGTDSAPNKQFAGVLQGLTGLPVGLGMGGIGGTLQAQRNNDTTYLAAMQIGMANMYCRPGYIIDLGGQFELQDPTNGGIYADFAACFADYPNQIMEEQDGIDLLCGLTPRMLVPLGPVLGSSDVNSQRMKRLFAVTMQADYPTRVVRGPYLDCCYRANQTNAQSDVYHLSSTTLSFGTAPVVTHLNSGYGLQRRRLARRLAHLRDPIANPSDFNGPRMTGAAKTSATTIDVTFDPNGGTLALRNTGYLPSIGAAADFRCGLDFLTVADSLDFNAGNALFPTNATVTGNVVTFTFGASLPATVYVCVARGARPFFRNPNDYTLHVGSGGTGTNAIGLDPFTRASMVCSDYTGAEFNDFNGTTTTWVEVQPYWGPSPTINNQDYIAVT